MWILNNMKNSITKKTQAIPNQKNPPKTQRVVLLSLLTQVPHLYCHQCYTQTFLEQAAVSCLNNSELAEFLHRDNRKKLSFVS